MTNLQRRLREHRSRKARKERIISAGKIAAIKAFVSALALVMLFAWTRFPFAHAYFTAKAMSEKRSAIVTKNKSATTYAGITFEESLLIEDKAELYSFSALTFTEASYDDPDVDDYLVPAEDASYQDEVIYARIWLSDDFYIGDVFIPSITIHYNGQSTQALSGVLEADSLRVAFARPVLSSWFNDLEEDMAEVIFSVTGEGYVAGLELFTFTGEGVLQVGITSARDGFAADEPENDILTETDAANGEDAESATEPTDVTAVDEATEAEVKESVANEQDYAVSEDGTKTVTDGAEQSGSDSDSASEQVPATTDGNDGDI